jgi:hypothetical protein
MLVCASIIAQPVLSQGIKKSFSTTMQGNYAGFAQSVVAIIDLFVRQALADSWLVGLVSPWSHRERPPGQRVSLDRLQPIIDKFDGAADLGLREWHVKEPLDFLRDFRLRQVSLVPEPVSILLHRRGASPIANSAIQARPSQFASGRHHRRNGNWDATKLG